MKRLFESILLASAMLALFSCTREEIPSPVQETREFVITATREGDGPDTKTEIVGGHTYWSVGDKISVFFGSGSAGGAEFTSTNTEPAASADFTGVLNAVTGSENGSSSQKYFWGVYPYNEQNSLELSGGSNLLTTVVPDYQYGVAESFSPGQNIWIARSLGLEMSFKSLLSGIKFTFSTNDITKIVIKGKNGEYLAGTVKVSMDSGVPVVTSVSSGKTSITLVPESGMGTFQAGVVYYALFLPTNFTEGLTVRIYKADGTVGIREYGSLDFIRNGLKSASSVERGVQFQSPSYVDMGNGLKVATFNLGAVSPHEAGDLYAWGETATKPEYTWDNYKYGSSETTITKYVGSSDYGSLVDHRTQLEAMDDPATMFWGPGWRVPTIMELKTLCDATLYDWAWTSNYNNTGVRGYTVTSKSTSNTIFLPAPPIYEGSYTREGVYWSSTVDSSRPNWAQMMFFSQMNGYLADYVSPRYLGRMIRPIYAGRKAVTGVSLNYTTLMLSEGRTASLTATVAPEDAYEKELVWTSSNPAVVDVGAVVASASGVRATINSGTAGSARITVMTVDGGLTATCDVTVNSQATGVSLDRTNIVFYGYPYTTTMAPVQLTATVTPSTANQTVNWSSSNDLVATVSDSGLVTPVGNGTAVITAEKNGIYEATCTVTVDAWEHVTDISVRSNILIVQGSSYKLVPQITPSTAHDKSVFWSSSEPLVATVTQDGVVTAQRPGVVEVSVASQEGFHYYASCVVTVISGYENGQPYVDFGNGYKVAPYNLVNVHPLETDQSYFAWGVTSWTPGWAPIWENYSYFKGWNKNGNYPLMSKYVVNPAEDLGYNGWSDGKAQLDPADDPARALWGGRWVTPSKEEWEAIASNADFQERTILGVKGMLVTSLYTFGQVFIPYSGKGSSSMSNPIQLDDVGEGAYLWTRSVYAGTPNWAWAVELSSGYTKGYYVRWHERRVVMSIRPIFRD